MPGAKAFADYYSIFETEMFSRRRLGKRDTRRDSDADTDESDQGSSHGCCPKLSGKGKKRNKITPVQRAKQHLEQMRQLGNEYADAINNQNDDGISFQGIQTLAAEGLENANAMVGEEMEHDTMPFDLDDLDDDLKRELLKLDLELGGDKAILAQSALDMMDEEDAKADRIVKEAIIEEAQNEQDEESDSLSAFFRNDPLSSEEPELGESKLRRLASNSEAISPLWMFSLVLPLLFLVILLIRTIQATTQTFEKNDRDHDNHLENDYRRMNAML